MDAYPEPDALDDTQLASPIIKIPGGKRDLAEAIASRMPEKFEAYIEPFFGGGAVFFYLYRQGRLPRSCTISDLDQSLMEMYQAVKEDPKDISDRLLAMHEEYIKAPEECYYHVRQLWNHRHRSPAKNIFLRYAGFNGVWRENKKGEMNVPWGKRGKLFLPSIERLQAVSTAFRRADLLSAGFDQTLAICDDDKRPGTVVYCDPPYLDGWTGYTQYGWGTWHAELLASKCEEWSKAGAHVVLSHSDVEVFRDILSRKWPSATIHTVERRNKLNRNGDGRGLVAELIVTSPSPS